MSKKNSNREKKKQAYLLDKKIYHKAYPAIMVEPQQYAHIDLVNEIENISRSIDFRQSSGDLKRMMHDHKVLPGSEFSKKYASQEPIESVDDSDLGYAEKASKTYMNLIGYSILEDSILIHIYRKLKESGAWDKFMPIHNLVVCSHFGDFKIYIDSLRTHHSPYGNGYYAKQPSFVDIKNEKGIIEKRQIAFSIHALERLFFRMCKSEPNEFLDAKTPEVMHGIVFESKCEVVNVNGESVIAIYEEFKSGPEIPYSLYHKIAYELLDRMDNFKILCGYCPVGFCNENFIHLKTFLTPGMRGTPEEKLISDIKDQKIKQKYKDLVDQKHFSDEYIELLKFFQSSGCLIANYLN